MNVLTLNCWVRSVEYKGIFQVKISKTKTVFDLQKAVKNEISATFRDVDAYDVTLYKPKNPVPKPHKENLSKLVLSEHGEFLVGVDELSEIFPALLPKHDIHIIVDAPSTIICWLRGTTLDASFLISIQPNEGIDRLIPRIKDAQSSLRSVDNHHIRFYKISGDENKLQESLNKTGGGEQLRGVSLVPNFLDVPVLAPLRVIIDVPLAPVSQKHSLKESSIAKALKRARIFGCTPSSIGYPKYREIQGTEERLLDRRRISDDAGGAILDDEVPLISLIFQPFGVFLDTYRLRSEGDPGEAALPLVKRLVDQFAIEAAKIYPEENRRRDACLHLLNQIFSIVAGDSYKQIAPGPVQDTYPELTTDGHSTGPRGEPICIVAVKNEQAGIRSIPVIQLTSYYAHLVKRFQTTLSSSRLPTLGITIVGPVITFCALVCLHGRFHYTSLTPGLSCVEYASDGDDRKDLYRAFTAATTLLRDIATSLNLSYPLKSPFFPMITHLPSVESPGTTIQFRIENSIVNTLGRYVYHAITSDGSHLVVKFTSRYSVDLHMYCALQGRAPKLRGFGRLPGNILGIAMDFVLDAQSIMDRSPAEQREWATQLQQLVESFHANGYVHGDLRYPNIPFANGKAWLLDYDWAGKENEVSYPHRPLARELTDGRDHDDLKITKADDRRVLKLTLRRIGIGVDD